MQRICHIAINEENTLALTLTVNILIHHWHLHAVQELTTIHVFINGRHQLSLASRRSRTVSFNAMSVCIHQSTIRKIKP